jgi:hypothetical protein
MKRVLQIAGLLAGFFAGSWAVNARAAEPLAVVQQRAERLGYRVRGVRWDPVLQQRWAVLENVAHPELPLLAELTDGGGNAPAGAAAPAVNAVPVYAVFKPAELAVRSGDRVVLWSTEKNLRMEMGAVAEGNAAVGERVSLRVTGAGVNGDAGWRASGIVRGPGSVEMEP